MGEIILEEMKMLQWLYMSQWLFIKPSARMRLKVYSNHFVIHSVIHSLCQQRISETDAS